MNCRYVKKVKRLGFLSNHCFFSHKEAQVEPSWNILFYLEPMFDHCGAMFGHLAAICDTFRAILAKVPKTQEQKSTEPYRKERTFFANCL